MVQLASREGGTGGTRGEIPATPGPRDLLWDPLWQLLGFWSILVGLYWFMLAHTRLASSSTSSLSLQYVDNSGLALLHCTLPYTGFYGSVLLYTGLYWFLPLSIHLAAILMPQASLHYSDNQGITRVYYTPHYSGLYPSILVYTGSYWTLLPWQPPRCHHPLSSTWITRASYWFVTLHTSLC